MNCRHCGAPGAEDGCRDCLLFLSFIERQPDVAIRLMLEVDKAGNIPMIKRLSDRIHELEVRLIRLGEDVYPCAKQ